MTQRYNIGSQCFMVVLNGILDIQIIGNVA
jgi:hypothetical protein